MVEGVTVGTRTVPVEELEARKSAVFNALSLLLRASEWKGGECVVIRAEDARLARAVVGELAWVHEWLAELIREHEDWVESLRR